MYLPELSSTLGIPIIGRVKNNRTDQNSPKLDPPSQLLATYVEFRSNQTPPAQLIMFDTRVVNIERPDKWKNIRLNMERALGNVYIGQ